ncbi:cysteine hydrolase family protein [Cupriavidus sp. 2TAF22]|uniref:cysteine hydrolase family protein n=1 Tax=unclassified Cupriavidus TaxID=2640874 RepID=UPI003F916402
MRQALLIIDIQPSFSPPPWLVERVAALVGRLPTVATVERHDEAVTPFRRQLGWAPAPADDSLVAADQVFVKHGYAPSPDTIAHLQGLNLDRVLVCGIQTETCVLAAGFALFDAGLQPTLLEDLTVGSSLDVSGGLGIRLWRHHFGHVLRSGDIWSENGPGAAA